METIEVFAIDWHSLFIPKLPLLDVVCRTLGIYTILQLGMRFLGRENLQQAANYKMVTIFLVGAFGGRAVLGEDTSLTSCSLGLSVVLCLNALTSYAIYHSPRFAAFMEGPITHHLIKDGQIQLQAMQATKCTEDVLKAHLRTHGETDLLKVQDAYMERHGVITFIMK